MTDLHHATPSGKPRARSLGVPFQGVPGALNAITDVTGVEVGYATIVRGEGPLVVGTGPVRTGVSAIFPRGMAGLATPVFAGCHSLNGNGEMTGFIWIEEAGRLDGPITITNTHSCGLARDAMLRWMVERGALDLSETWGLPVAAETYDGYLNDINGFHVREEHVFEALDSAAGGAIEEGSIGGGTGMICYGFKGGSGTASRRVETAGAAFTLGAFVQANFGAPELLTIAGVPVGRCLAEGASFGRDTGSVIGILATDAPLLPHQLRRLAKRCGLGIARSGGVAARSPARALAGVQPAGRVGPGAPPALFFRLVEVDVALREGDGDAFRFEALLGRLGQVEQHGPIVRGLGPAAQVEIDRAIGQLLDQYLRRRVGRREKFLMARFHSC